MLVREQGKINIREVEPEIFKKVVKFMYEQDLEFDHEEELEGVLDAADRFDFGELKTKVNEMVKEVLDEDNVLAIADLAKLYNAKELLASCIEAVVRLEVKVEEEDVVRRPRVALALLEYWREEAGRKEVELAEKDEVLRNREEQMQNMREDIMGGLHGYSDDDDEPYYLNDGSDLDITACDKDCGYCGHCPY